MSTPLYKLMLGMSDDPRKVELVQSLIEKTRQGKIPWVKQASALTASIPSGVQVNFVLSPLTFLKPFSWQLLTIRDRGGNELVRVSNDPNMISVLAGKAVSPLVAVADELYSLVNTAAGDDLDRAINTIKNL
jgi:hypothetical protein